MLGFEHGERAGAIGRTCVGYAARRHVIRLSPAAKKQARLLYGASYGGGLVKIYPLRSVSP
jgi:hypothetical protein